MKLVVLGISQDGGYPQAGCNMFCCKSAWENTNLKLKVSCLGIVDSKNSKCWIIDATPDFPNQLNSLNSFSNKNNNLNLEGIFLTHAHSGHYTGLVHLGKESMATNNVPIYTLPKMSEFIENNHPWKFYMDAGYYIINKLKKEDFVQLSNNVIIKPIYVPHRSEFTETVGYHIQGVKSSVLYIPDIDSWDQWDQSINEWISKVDFAFLDGTFFDKNEITNRDITKIAHPLIIESIDLFSKLNEKDRTKIYFTHLNHTNPAIKTNSKERKLIEKTGSKIAHENFVIEL